jgi:murein DD-endopeptidase MepM/ murein hydrolase activator NlpD
MIRVLRLGIALVVLATLAACARKEPPAPIVGSSTPARPAAVNAPVAAALRPTPGEWDGEIVVRPGESLYVVARRANVPTRTLIEANDLKPPYALTPGRRLALPRVRTHEVQSGDTLANIARRYGLGTNELVRANALQPPYAVQVGQVLNLPGVVEAPVVASLQPGPNAAAPASVAPVSAVPRGAIESTTLPPTAAAPTSVTAPAAAPVAAGAPSALPPLPAAKEIGAAPSAAPVAAAQPASLPVPQQLAPPPEPDDVVPSGRPGRGFLWPVRGNIISDFGSKPGGLQNDGINIAAARGTPIRAADTGTVVYAGNELKGFGNLLLVRHAEGWITAYAHADELLVKRGDEVRRGQTVGRVGATGGVASPQLHFEVRRGSRPHNPRDVLGPLTASAQ